MRKREQFRSKRSTAQMKAKQSKTGREFKRVKELKVGDKFRVFYETEEKTIKIMPVLTVTWAADKAMKNGMDWWRHMVVTNEQGESEGYSKCSTEQVLMVS